MAEFATGEGKTLSAGQWLPSSRDGPAGPAMLLPPTITWPSAMPNGCAPCFTSVVNTSSHVISEMEADDRRAAYGCDVTYTTGKEVVADFLRDRPADGSLSVL